MSPDQRWAADLEENEDAWEPTTEPRTATDPSKTKALSRSVVTTQKGANKRLGRLAPWLLSDSLGQQIDIRQLSDIEWLGRQTCLLSET